MRFAIPVALLLALCGLFFFGLKQDPRLVPSPLIGKLAPAFSLPALGGQPATVTPQQFAGRPVLINFFASWCAGCQDEHPVLMGLAQQGVEIIGMDYKDTEPDAQAWLAQHGNPYRTVVVDGQGTAGLDWGVYGVPETFVLNAAGQIVYKHVGPLTEAIFAERIRPLLEGKAP